MKFLLWIGLIVISAISGLAVEVVIKTDPEEKKEEKTEEKGPELPKVPILKINAINLTDKEFIVTVSTRLRDSSEGFAIVQNAVDSGGTKTLGTFTGKEATLFEFVEAQVVMKGDVTLGITCKVAAPDEKEAEKSDKPKDGDKGGDDALEGNGETAENSIDVWLYPVENQSFPSCNIKFDSI